MLELASALDVLAVIVGKGELVQRAADDGLRLVALGDDHGRQPVVAGRDPAVAADEVDVVRPLHQELGHDRVVVVVLREMAVGAHLGVGVARQIGARVGRPAVLGIPGWLGSCTTGGPPRTVCGTLVLKAMPDIPSPEIVCCWT